MNSSELHFADSSGSSVLDLGSSDQVLSLLDSLDRGGGLQAVATWVQQELLPGRRVLYRRPSRASVDEAVIYDRSLSRLDDAGQPSGQPIVAPVTDEKFGDSELLGTWSRPLAKEPFFLRVRVTGLQKEAPNPE